MVWLILAVFEENSYDWVLSGDQYVHNCILAVSCSAMIMSGSPV